MSNSQSNCPLVLMDDPAYTMDDSEACMGGPISDDLVSAPRVLGRYNPNSSFDELQDEQGNPIQDESGETIQGEEGGMVASDLPPWIR